MDQMPGNVLFGQFDTPNSLENRANMSVDDRSLWAAQISVLRVPDRRGRFDSPACLLHSDSRISSTWLSRVTSAR